MNKILLNILMVVGFQQFILGAEANIILGPEVNENPEPKLGVCLSCYSVSCQHKIHDTYTKEDPSNCKECVKEVYPVC